MGFIANLVRDILGEGTIVAEDRPQGPIPRFVPKSHPPLAQSKIQRRDREGALGGEGENDQTRARKEAVGGSGNPNHKQRR